MNSNNYWQDKRVCVTGGAGFLGRVVVRKLKERGAKDVFIPLIEDYNLVQLDDINRMLADSNPDLIIHLAAQVGGIGANREHPAEFFYNNLMMGVQLMHRAWEMSVDKFYIFHYSVPFCCCPCILQRLCVRVYCSNPSSLSCSYDCKYPTSCS